MRARLSTPLAALALLVVAPAAAAATAPAQAAATGGVSVSSRPASTSAGTGGSQAGKVPARQTRDSLARAARNIGRRELRRGSRGRDVLTLQRVLTELGYRVRTTSYFGAGTEAQVKRFQQAWHLPVIGIVGPATGAALRSSLRGGKPAAAPVAPAAPTPAPVVSVNGWAFPVRGAHDYGDAADRYGAPRSGHTHQGQDILSKCGTPLVAARGGKVVGADFGGAAGNYFAVHTADTQYDYFYAHLRDPALLKEGATVQTGQVIGYVGETGDAVGCHLHIELWDGLWWNGGHTIDPLPFLKAWDR